MMTMTALLTMKTLMTTAMAFLITLTKTGTVMATAPQTLVCYFILKHKRASLRNDALLADDDDDDNDGIPDDADTDDDGDGVPDEEDEDHPDYHDNDEL